MTKSLISTEMLPSFKIIFTFLFWVARQEPPNLLPFGFSVSSVKMHYLQVSPHLSLLIVVVPK